MSQLLWLCAQGEYTLQADAKSTDQAPARRHQFAFPRDGQREPWLGAGQPQLRHYARAEHVWQERRFRVVPVNK